MHLWVARTSVMATLLFTYPHVHGCGRLLDMRLSIASTSTPRRPSTDKKRGRSEKVAGYRNPYTSSYYPFTTSE